MSIRENGELSYSIFDPTGNITILVESPVPVERQPSAAAALMRRHPEAEQVGFVRFGPEDEEPQVELRMAGGEFCGNASMSAAALFCLRKGTKAPETVLLRVSGAEQPVRARLRREAGERFFAGLRMPDALEIAETELRFGRLCGSAPAVRMQGISHLVIDEASPFAALRESGAAEAALRAWCGELGAEGLGLMFLEGSGEALRLTPLVYVPGSGTVFWESSCASGSAAVGMMLAARTGASVSLRLAEPGGSLQVESDPDGETWLYGHTRRLR